MKNIFKKNSIIITALAIMIVIAGYLSFTNKDAKKDALTASKKASVKTEKQTDLAKTDDGLKVAVDTTGTTTAATTGTPTGGASKKDTSKKKGASTDTTDKKTADKVSKNDISDEDILADSKDVADNGELNLEDGTPGEAVLANTADASYFVDARLKREQARAKSKENYLQIIDSTDVTAKEKQEAIDNMLELTDNIEKEAAAEVLLESKGFDDSVVFIVDGKATVAVNASNLTDQQRAIIENIVKSETGIAVNKMDIIPVVVEE